MHDDDDIVIIVYSQYCIARSDDQGLYLHIMESNILLYRADLFKFLGDNSTILDVGKFRIFV